MYTQYAHPAQSLGNENKYPAKMGSQIAWDAKLESANASCNAYINGHYKQQSLSGVQLIELKLFGLKRRRHLKYMENSNSVPAQ